MESYSLLGFGGITLSGCGVCVVLVGGQLLLVPKYTLLRYESDVYDRVKCFAQGQVRPISLPPDDCARRPKNCANQAVDGRPVCGRR
jgi:hypothetical protein